MIEIYPTNTCPPDFEELTARTTRFASFAPHVQLDISDGVFTPELSWPYGDGQWAQLEAMASRATPLPLSERFLYEAHLMVEEPVRLGELLARAGCARILPHLEVFAEANAVREAFSLWKAAGAREVGLALLLDTPLSQLDALIGECSVVQLMSIATLGRQGAVFEPSVLERIRELRLRYPEVLIAIDGGVSENNIADLARAGASRFGVGSALTKSADPKATYDTLKSLAESALQ